MNAPIVVTGLGVVAPNGLGVDEYWDATLAGRSGIGPVRRFDARGYPATLAGEVPDFEASDHLPGRLLPQTDQLTRLAMVAADWALADAGLPVESEDHFDIGVVTANCAGGFEFGQHELENLWSNGSSYVSAYQSFAWFYAVNSGQISIKHNLRGPSGVLVSDQAGGLDAVRHACRQLGKDSAAMVTGGIDATICPWGWVAQLAGGRLSTVSAADRAYLPFDEAAQGFVPGEGGAILVVEPLPAARSRNAERIYGQLAGYGASFDPRPGSGRASSLRYAIEQALVSAGVGAAEIDVVFADAAAVPQLDRIEADTIAEVFGADAVPVTAPKTMTGRLYSGSGPLDLVAGLLAIRDQVIPPTVNVTPAEQYPIDLVTEARRARIRTVLVLARGYPGFNSAIVLRAVG